MPVMIALRNLAVNFLVSLGICATCVIGDKLVELSRNAVLKAICDNLTHGIVGFLSAILLVINFKEKLLHKESYCLAVLCLLISCLIDVDHFIAAKSMRLMVSNFCIWTIKGILHFLSLIPGCN